MSRKVNSINYIELPMDNNAETIVGCFNVDAKVSSLGVLVVL